MLTIEVQGIHTMNWGRKGVLSMLAVVVLWTAMPASACLLAMHPAGQPACCRGMAQECGATAMGASDSCCQAHPQNAAVTPVPPYTLQHSQKLAFVPHLSGLQLNASSGAECRTAFEAPPPKFPPGGAFALRI